MVMILNRGFQLHRNETTALPAMLEKRAGSGKLLFEVLRKMRAHVLMGVGIKPLPIDVIDRNFVLRVNSIAQ